MNTILRPCDCRRFARSRPYRPERDCDKCWLYAHNAIVRQAWGGDPAECAPPPAPLEPRDVAGLAPLSKSRIDPSALITHPGGYAFNGSCIRYRGRTLFAYRSGWAGSNIHICELSDGDRPSPSITLELRHPLASYGREDPRLFEFGGRLHIAYVGFDGDWNSTMATNQLYARLRENFTVEAEFAPKIDGRPWGRWEKNWGFFESGDELYAIYSIDPHIVLRIRGDHAEIAGKSETPFDWVGGHLRGGAPPRLVAGEYWHWFHGMKELGAIWPTRIYSLGLCTFEALPPFRITRLARDPIAWADHSTRPPDQYCSVIFPGGTQFDGTTWRISCGIHDRWLEVFEYAHADVLRWLDTSAPSRVMPL